VKGNLPPRRGVTLIELVAATALASLMMVAMVGVLQAVSQQTSLAQRQRHVRWPSRFEELLRRDLLAAERLHASDGFVWLTGELANYRDPDACEFRSVGYGCIATGDRAALIRLDGDFRDFVAIGPRRIVLERLDSTGDPQPLPQSPGPVPRHVRIWLWEAPNEEPTYSSDIVLY
jgi:hypothetical protein